MYFIKENGTEQITQFAIENWWISDYMSFLTKNASFYIQANCSQTSLPIFGQLHIFVSDSVIFL